METVEVTRKGPLFDGRAQKAATAYLDVATAEVSDDGVNLVHAQLGSVLKHPTGYYEHHIVTDVAHDGHMVTDGGVVYGPWLEGVGSRNHSTRFKGYATFRRMTQVLDRRAQAIADQVLGRFIGRMN